MKKRSNPNSYENIKGIEKQLTPQIYPQTELALSIQSHFFAQNVQKYQLKMIKDLM